MQTHIWRPPEREKVVCLGKGSPKVDPRTLKLSRYLTSELPTAPASCSYRQKVTTWPMMLNDSLGDCAEAAMGHMIEQWTTYADAPGAFTPTDAEVEQAYETQGYVPGDPSTDNGTVLLTFLNTCRNTSTIYGGHPIQAYAALDTISTELVQQTVYLFGNCYIGVALPLSAQSQSLWAVDESNPANAQPGSWGGHCIPIVAYDSALFYVVTWGEVIGMTPAFLKMYCDEAYAVYSKDWMEGRGVTPSGFNAQQMLADVKAVAA